MKILYIGHIEFGSTSRHRADALKRLGHEVILVDPYLALASYLKGRFRGAFHYRTGYHLMQVAVTTWINALKIKYIDWPELVWVDSGELFGLKAVRELGKFYTPMVLYNHDDPSGHRDGMRWNSLLSALPEYDLCVVVREENITEFRLLGARNVFKVFRSYDELAHQPFVKLDDIPVAFRSEVAFIGTWIPKELRDDFMLSLVKRDVPLSIWGDRWDRSPNWLQIKHCWRGPAIYGRDYVAAVQGAKVTLGLLSKGNRDLHTTRSSEIPYAGGLLCAQRTSEHQQMYEEGVEAVFWDSVDECADVCHSLLSNDELRNRIRINGQRKVEIANLGHEAVLKNVIDRLSDIRAKGL